MFENRIEYLALRVLLERWADDFGEELNLRMTSEIFASQYAHVVFRDLVQTELKDAEYKDVPF